MKEINLALIKKRRKEMRITLQEMAETLGYSDASSYYRYEKGIYRFDATQLPVICDKLKFKMNEIFFYPSFAELANV